MTKLALPLVVSCMEPPCGACCSGQAALPISLVKGGGVIKPVRPLPDWLRDELLADFETFQREGWPKDNSPCIWYDAERKRCKHYLHRPDLCRDQVEVGDEACHRWRRSTGVEKANTFTVNAGRLVRV